MAKLAQMLWRLEPALLARVRRYAKAQRVSLSKAVTEIIDRQLAIRGY